MHLPDKPNNREERPQRYAVVNRQVIERAPLTEIRLPPRELRSISKKAVAVAKTLLTKFGQQQPLLISEHDELVAGQEFLIAAQELGWNAINVVRTIDLTPDQLRVLRLALQKLPELSVWDEDALRLELTELAELDFEVELEDISGFSTTEIDLIVEGPSEPEENDPADDLPQALNGPAVTLTGDLWILGGIHRLYCGDARDSQTYAALMGGEKARMVFTDPPYNIPIAGHVSGLGQVKHGNWAMGCGEMSEDQFTAFLTSALGSMAGCCTDGALVYVCMDRRHLLELQLAARAVGLSTVDLCIWNKLSGGMGSFYRSQHEPVFVFKTGAGPHRNNIELGRHGRYRTNVWNYSGFASFGPGRKRAPLATGRQNIKDRVEHRTQTDFARTPDMAGRGKEKREDQPLRIVRVACVTQMIAPILLPGDFSPDHCDLHRIFANPTESQRAEITSLFFGQALKETAARYAAY